MQQTNPDVGVEMIQVMAVGMMVLVVQLLVKGGMVHTIALYSNRKRGVMSALTW